MSYVGNSPAEIYSSVQKQDLTGGSGTGFTLSYPVTNANEISVFVNNVRQEPTEAYTVSGTTLTMTGSIAASDDFYIIFSGLTQGTITPPDASVTTAKIANNAVTSAKLDTNIDIAGTLDVTGILTADAGIKLGGTASANLLNDYEEGTWTPTDTSGASLSLTLVTTQNYVKIGSLVFVNFYVTYTTTVSSSVQQLGGLPFTAKTYNHLNVRNASYGANNILMQTNAGTTDMRLYNSNTRPTNADISGNYLLGSGCYFTDD